MTRDFCDLCGLDMTDVIYERYSLQVRYANDPLPNREDRHVGLLCEECISPALQLIEDVKSARENPRPQLADNASTV